MWTNFLPVLIWALGFGLLLTWNEHVYKREGWKVEPGEDRAAGQVWLFGCLLFFLLGIVLTSFDLK